MPKGLHNQEFKRKRGEVTFLQWTAQCSYKKKTIKTLYKEPLYGLFLKWCFKVSFTLGRFFLFVFLFTDTNNFVLRLLQKKKSIFRSVCSKKVNKLISFLWIRKWSKLYVKSSSSREIPCGSLLFSWCLSLYAQQYRKTKFRWICFI